jgi:hypothetical protein
MDNVSLPFASSTATSIVLEILAEAEKNISRMEFAKRNQSEWVIYSQQSYINDAFRHLKKGPEHSPTKNDREPATILHDTMTNTGANPSLMPTIFNHRASQQCS